MQPWLKKNLNFFSFRLNLDKKPKTPVSGIQTNSSGVNYIYIYLVFVFNFPNVMYIYPYSCILIYFMYISKEKISQG